jgi:NitT/TauT family transport system permease protein
MFNESAIRSRLDWLRLRNWRSLSYRALSFWALIILLLLWLLGSEYTRFLPSTEDVLKAIPVFLSDPSTYLDVMVTLKRVAGALAISMVVGFLAAYFMSKKGFVGGVISVYVNLALGLPSTIAALLALFIFKRSEIGVYAVVAVTTFPFIVITLLGGLRSADRRLDEMSHVYRLGNGAHIQHVSLPHIVPYVIAALRNENAHAWRVVVLAEVFAVNSGMGARFTRAFDRFRIVDVILWLLAFMTIMLSTEYLVLRPIERYVLRWREGSRTEGSEGNG